MEECPQCGASVNEAATFCRSCGASTTDADASDGDSTARIGRRNLLVYGGGIVVAAVGGLVGFLTLTGSRGPKGTVRKFVGALDGGNVQQANALLHPAGAMNSVKSSRLSSDAVSVSIESIRTVSRDGDRAELTGVLRISGGLVGDEQVTLNTSFEVRKLDGEWRIWSMK